MVKLMSVVSTACLWDRWQYDCMRTEVWFCGVYISTFWLLVVLRKLQ